jgi:hypothetical protein
MPQRPPAFSSPRFCRLLIAFFASVVLAFVPWANAREMDVPGGKLEVEFASPPTVTLEKNITRWIQNSARAVSDYYGTFTVRRATLRIMLTTGHEVSGGQAFGYDGALIKISVGRSATDADLVEDWQLTHEMLHLGFPDVPDQHLWIEEGLATYVEPIARCRVGLITPERVWGDLVEGLPQGEPAAGDQGLDHTHTWGRTYWGGALFCLRADVEIRRRTGNRFGLEHVLRAIHAAGGTIESQWKLDRAIAIGDAATGVPVLRELYDEMKASPVTVDLPALWKQLGVLRSGQTVKFDPAAPLGAIRKAITVR